MGKYKLPTKFFGHWLVKKLEKGKIKIKFSHYEKNKKVSEFITDDEIKEWNSEQPVFISAQTGAGKTSFIIEELIAGVADTYNNEKKHRKESPHILIISYRIALNRQLKLDVADAIIDFIGEERYSTVVNKYLKPEGIDKKIDFGPVHICSYQQLSSFELTSHNYEYIICDECHFFTSDSSFNADTHRILENIVIHGSESVRIYMSATPEVAFEAIVRAEYETTHGTHTINDVLDAFGKRKKEKNPLNILYYDMKRDYHQFDINIENDRDALYESIRKEKGQWLIFVRSKSDGKKLEDLFNNSSDESEENKNDVTNKEDGAIQKTEKESKKMNAVFISSENKSTDGTASKKEFDMIVEKGKFECKYLIATSVLDNGISIVADKINGIVIDNFFDRVEVLQMIGRLRINDCSKRKVYIIIPDIKNEYETAYLNLLVALSPDCLLAADKVDYNNFINKISKYTREIYGNNTHPGNMFYKNMNKFNTSSYGYNICAVLYLIDRVSFLKRFTQKDITLSDSMRALRKKLFDYYMNEGSEKSWSRNIIDLLEIESDRKKRDTERENAISRNKLRPNEDIYFYTYKLNSTFYNFIYTGLLSDHYKKIITSSFYRTLSYNQKEEFDNILNYEGLSCKSVNQKFMVIVKKYVASNEIPVDIRKLQYWFDELKRYEEFGYNENYLSAEEEIYRWFELPVPPPQEPKSESSNDETLDVTEDYFMKYVLDKHYEKVKKGTPESEINHDINMITDPDTGKKVIFNAAFIKKHGLWRRLENEDGSESDYSKFLRLKGLKALEAGDIITLKGKQFKVDELDAGNSQYKTAYFFIPLQ